MLSRFTGTKESQKELLNCVMTYAKEHQIGKVMLNPSQMGKPLYVNYGFQLLPDEYAFYLD